MFFSAFQYQLLVSDKTSLSRYGNWILCTLHQHLKDILHADQDELIQQQYNYYCIDKMNRITNNEQKVLSLCMLMNLATTGPDLMSSIQIQGAHWSGKSQGNLIFLPRSGKSQGILRNDQGNFKY